MKFGLNVGAWRSMKQTEVSLSSAESEVQALASTELLADYIKTLRESLCLSTPVMELMCDNTAAIALATGEGSWRTKSAANKVYAVKEKVDCGKLAVSYVSTFNQCADSLTKSLKGGQDQLRANLHLSSVNLENWLPRRGLSTKASGVQQFSDQTGVVGPRVSRVFFSEPGFRVRNFWGRNFLPCLDLPRLLEGKNVCVTTGKNLNFNRLWQSRLNL